MRKEIYSVKCPKQVQFGDPMYFEEYEGRKLQTATRLCGKGCFSGRANEGISG